MRPPLPRPPENKVLKFMIQSVSIVIQRRTKWQTVRTKPRMYHTPSGPK